MAISFDTSGTSSSYTVGAGSNNMLLAVFGGADTGSGPTGATYNGVAMTKVVDLSGVGSGPGVPGLFVYALANPATGAAHTIASTGGTGNFFCAASYHGVSQIYPSYQSAQAQSGGGAVTVSITPDTSNSWVVGVSDDTGTGPAIATLTSRANGNPFRLSDSNAAAGAGLYSVNFTTSNGQYYSDALFLLTPQQTYTLTAAFGTFSMTGIAATLLKGTAYFIHAIVGTFTLSGQTSLLTVFRKWLYGTKDSSVLTNKTKHSGSWSDNSKHSSNFTDQTKH